MNEKGLFTSSGTSFYYFRSYTSFGHSLLTMHRRSIYVIVLIIFLKNIVHKTCWFWFWFSSTYLSSIQGSQRNQLVFCQSKINNCLVFCLFVCLSWVGQEKSINFDGLLSIFVVANSLIFIKLKKLVGLFFCLSGKKLLFFCHVIVSFLFFFIQKQK